MIMFNDYLKLNRASAFLVSLFSGLFLIVDLAFIGLIKIDAATDFFNTNLITAYIPFVLSMILMILLGTLALILGITAVKMFCGRSRNFILTYRGRNYYLKMQLATITSSVTIILVCVYIFLITNQLQYYGERYNTSKFPPLAALISKYDIGTLFRVGLLMIMVYYFIMYIIDIFSNTISRYNRIIIRNFEILKFVIRVAVIGACGLTLFLLLESLYVSYMNPYRNLFVSSSIIPQGYITFALIMWTVTLIVDYMIFFKKKVLV